MTKYSGLTAIGFGIGAFWLAGCTAGGGQMGNVGS